MIPAKKRRNRQCSTAFNGYNNLRSIKRKMRVHRLVIDSRFLLRTNRTHMRLKLPTCPAIMQYMRMINFPFMMSRRRNIKFLSMVQKNFRYRVKIKGAIFMNMRKTQLSFTNASPYRVVLRPKLL